MKRVCVLIVATAFCGCFAGPVRSEPAVVARVELVRPLGTIPLPVRALLRDGAGVDYALVVARETELAQSGWPCRLLAQAGDPDGWVIATPMRSGAREAATGRFDVIADDGEQWLVRLRDEGETAALADLGFALSRLSLGPIVLTPPPPARLAAQDATEFTANPFAAAMMEGVTSGYLVGLVSQLSGEEPAPAAGELRAITSRHTLSGTPLQKAVEFGFEYFSALGLNPAYFPWSRSGCAGTNIAGNQGGSTNPDEIVLVVAHLDSMPSSGLAPGADDNASGAAGVLAVAAALSRYRFERTIRYLLVTGEEQGLLGSAVYAAEVRAAGDNLVAVLNLDMIGWDSNGDGIMRLYTRASSHPGYAADLAIASTFADVVATYGLALSPLITSNGMSASDHASFWNQGYPAICGIEHYQGDFNAYYHTANDRLSNLNLPYFTAFAKAATGAVAHLAGPLEEKPFDVVRVVSGDWPDAGATLGITIFHTRHQAGAEETGDALDLPCENPRTAWLKFATHSGADDLATDSRPAGSETLFEAALSVVSDGEPVTCANRLRFSFLTPPDPKRLYSARIQADGFLQVRDLRDLAAEGGFVELPALTGVANGTTYGWCDLATRFLRQEPLAIGAGVAAVSESQVLLRASVQAGTRVEDVVEFSTAMSGPDPWSAAGTWSSEVAVTADNFDAGWETLTLPVDVPGAADLPVAFFRIRRTWLKP